MGPVGWPEMVFIFLLALLLFGPKKLPELGRTLAKALAEFRRAQNELKATFDREMRSLERENDSLKEITSSYSYDNNNYNYSSYDSGSYGSEPNVSTANNAVTTTSASAPEGAESTPATHPEGTVASGSIAVASSPEGAEPGASASGSPAPSPDVPPVTGHQALKT